MVAFSYMPLLFLIVFYETRLFVTPFLSSNSLLFIAESLTALEINDINVHLMVILIIIAVVIRDVVN